MTSSSLRIAFITPKNPQSATSRYRCHHLAEALGSAATVSVQAVTDDTIRLDRPDVVVLHRLRWHGEANRVCAAARAVGAVVVASVDDLIFSPEYAFQVGLTGPTDDPTFYRYHRAEADDHLRTLREADAVLVSTRFLAGEVRAALGDTTTVYCLRNVLSREMLALAEAAHASRTRRLGLGAHTVTLGYLSGSPTHHLDFAEIAPVLADTMGRIAQTRLLLVGSVALPPILQPLADAGRVRRHPFVAWRDLFALTAQVDINLAPLDASRLFNHAKSEIKLLEAGAIGVPTVATATAGVVEAGAAFGTLVRTPEQWETALDRLSGSQGSGEEIRAAVLSQATVASIAGETVALFTELAARKTAGKTGSATITRSWRTRLAERLRATEAQWMQRGLRWERHRRLLRGELEEKGIG